MGTEHYCFCDLAPLYVLDSLNEEERAWVEQQIAECPELAEELAEYQSAATALPYSAPIAPISADLKDRLFARLDLAPPRPTPQPPTASYIAVRSQDLKWQPHPAPGITIAIVHTDTINREMTGFLRAEPGAQYPLHRHAAIEEIFMVEGDLIIGHEVYQAGDYIRSFPGSSHAPHTQGGCCFFFHSSMDDEYLEAI